VRLTLIARVSDGLPLAEGLDKDEDKDMRQHDYKGQAKVRAGLCVVAGACVPAGSDMRAAAPPSHRTPLLHRVRMCRPRRLLLCPQAIFKRLSQTPHSAQEPRVSIESGPCTFYYLLDGGVCFLTLTEKGYPKKLAFQYLEDLSREFKALYGPQVEGVTRPYAFIKFGACLADVCARPCLCVLGGWGGDCTQQWCLLRVKAHVSVAGARRKAKPPAVVMLSSTRTHRAPPATTDTFIQRTKKVFQDTRSQRNMAALTADLSEVHTIMSKNIAEVLGQGEKLDSECCA
jgi:hypothetical protein